MGIHHKVGAEIPGWDYIVDAVFDVLMNDHIKLKNRVNQLNETIITVNDDLKTFKTIENLKNSNAWLNDNMVNYYMALIN